MARIFFLIIFLGISSTFVSCGPIEKNFYVKSPRPVNLEDVNFAPPLNNLGEIREERSPQGADVPEFPGFSAPEGLADEKRPPKGERVTLDIKPDLDVGPLFEDPKDLVPNLDAVPNNDISATPVEDKPGLLATKIKQPAKGGETEQTIDAAGDKGKEPSNEVGEQHQPGNPYDFEYSVKDDKGNDYSHKSESDGDTIKGEYRVLLPDGRIQVVTYTANWKRGNIVRIKYI